MNLLRVIKEVLTPGNPEFRAQLTRLGEEELKIVKCLHLLSQPATQALNKGTDEAAEF